MKFPPLLLIVPRQSAETNGGRSWENWPEVWADAKGILWLWYSSQPRTLRRRNRVHGLFPFGPAWRAYWFCLHRPSLCQDNRQACPDPTPQGRHPASQSVAGCQWNRTCVLQLPLTRAYAHRETTMERVSISVGWWFVNVVSIHTFIMIGASAGGRSSVPRHSSLWWRSMSFRSPPNWMTQKPMGKDGRRSCTRISKIPATRTSRSKARRLRPSPSSSKFAISNESDCRNFIL